MGLDQYLHAEKYISGYHNGHRDLSQYQAVLDATGMNPLVAACDSPAITVSVTVAYWRKANAIHKWFVDNVQDGTDDCGRYFVGQDQLRDLLETAINALERYDAGDPDGAGQLLPPQGGFFFGNTTVDEWFASALRATITQLQPLVAADTMSMDFYYQSSW